MLPWGKHVYLSGTCWYSSDRPSDIASDLPARRRQTGPVYRAMGLTPDNFTSLFATLIKLSQKCSGYVVLLIGLYIRHSPTRVTQPGELRASLIEVTSSPAA